MGENGWRELSARAETQSPRSLFLVCGDTTYHKTGVAEKIAKAFANCRIVRFAAFAPNPTLEMVRQAVLLFNNANPDWIVAAGGGSAIDIAKCVKALAPAPECLEPDRPLRVFPPLAFSLSPVPFVAIPTTAGSGSEGTHFAVVYDGDRKCSVADAGLVPDVVVLDAALTATLSPVQAATTGLDAWAQAIEAFWSVRATAESDAYALEAFDRIHRALPGAIANHAAARDQMLRGAHLAGKAINIAQTTAAHAFSYAITKTFGLPHGHAVWMTLPGLICYNDHVSKEDCIHPGGAAEVCARIKRLAERCGRANGDGFARFCVDAVCRFGLDLRWSGLGVCSRSEILVVLRQVNTDRLKNNPREMDVEAFLDGFLHPMQESLREACL